MPANRTFSLCALFTLVCLGCNSVLGIQEKTRGAALVDGGGGGDSAGGGDSEGDANSAGGGDSADGGDSEGDANSGGFADGGSFALTIVKPAARLEGTQPAVRVVRGSTASLDLAVSRSDGFDGTVIVLVSGLARGITAEPLILSPSQTAGTLTIRAADSTDLGPSSLSILGAHNSLVSSPLDVPLIAQDAPGTPDKTFGDGGKVVLPVASGGVGPGGIRLQSNGFLVLCGYAKRDGFDSSVAIARITTSGALDPKFNEGAGFALGNSPGSKADSCASMFLRPNGGSIVFTGFATPEANQPHVLMTGRYRPEGYPDQNFGTPPVGGFVTTPLDGTRSEGYSVVGPTAGDTFVVGGLGRSRPALLRFKKEGVPDMTFDSGNAQELAVQGGIRWLAQHPSGDLVAAIDSSTFLLARFSSTGAIDKTFGDAGTKSVGDPGSSAAVVLVQSDDAVLVIGTQTLATGDSDMALARLTKSGQLDPAFGVAGLGMVHFAGSSTVSSAVESDGAIVIAGQTPTEAGPAFTVVRVSGNGSLDTTFGTAGRQVLGVGRAQAIMVDDLGRILVAGFTGGTTEGSLVVYRLWP